MMIVRVFAIHWGDFLANFPERYKNFLKIYNFFNSYFYMIGSQAYFKHMVICFAVFAKIFHDIET